MTTFLPDLVRYDLACGQTPREGFQGIDLYAPSVQHRVNLLRFPWTTGTGEPIKDGSVDELHCSHFVEHIPMCFVNRRTNATSHIPEEGMQDLFMAFFDEAWRVLKMGGVMTVVVPYLWHNRAFQDPTHRRFISETNFLYLAKGWRDVNKLDHYGVSCNFDMHIDRHTPPVEAIRNPEAQAHRVTHLVNVVTDITARLTKVAA